MQHNAFPGSYASSASVIFLVLKNNGARNIPWIFFTGTTDVYVFLWVTSPLNFLTSINLLLMIVKIKRNTRSYSVMPSVTSEGTHPCKTCDGRHLHVFIYNRILISVQSSEWRLSKPTGVLYSILTNPSFKTNLSFCKIYQHQNLQLILQDFPSKIYNYIVYNYICVYNSLQFTRHLTHTSIILKHY